VTLAALATGGGISVKQARKWLANRRVRTGNTLPYNRAVHPRRLLRQRRHRQQRRGQSFEEDCADQRQPLHSTPLSAVAVEPSLFVGVPVFHDGGATFQTSAPLSDRPPRRGGRFEANSAASGEDFTAEIRHRPYDVPGRFACTGRGLPSSVTPVLRHHHQRSGYIATAAAAVNFTSVHQMAPAQLNVFNLFNSA